VENTIFLLADHPDLVREVLTAIDQANDAAFEAILASPCELIHFCDNLDSSASTPYFDLLMREYYEKRVGQLHRAGKYAVVHLDGRVRGLLPRLAACGFDGVESITPRPVGDVPIEELRSLAGGPRTILWGGIPGAMFSEPWTADDIRRHTRLLLECLAGDGRLIVGSADQIPPNGNLDYCRIIADTIEEWAG
jgi:uroporphyrinogen-III decarboxylase